jgi:HD-GYP domain-containing protein (c-di-GMP phosphodiesterase class II)
VEQVRLAELLAALSLGVDLGFNQPMEHVLRQTVIALHLADELGLSAEDRGALYNASLLVNVACHSDAHEQAKWFGDDLALKAGKYAYGIRGPKAALASVKVMGGIGRPLLERFRIGMQFAAYGRREVASMIESHAALAAQFALQLGMPPAVVDAVRGSYEQWDGKGWPGERKGDAVPLAARIAHLAEFTEAAHRAGGVAAATALARKQSGKQFDPALVELFVAHATELLGDLDAVDSWDLVINHEPALTRPLTDDEFDVALTAIANFVDLKSPYTLGHSGAVADLASRAGQHLGMSSVDVATLRRAALVTGFGRLGVSNAIWDKPAPLATGEWERVRMHPYLAQRMLQQSPRLAALSDVAVQYRERLDGSGYPAGLRGGAISRLARVLGAADAYQAMREPRPYRAALVADVAAKELANEVSAGRLDGEAVNAVLAAAGHRVRPRHDAPAGLTQREVEVLRLLARGLSNKDIAQVLTISPKTAGNHIEHIYSKIGISTRAAASLFAVQQGLLVYD